MTRKRKKSFGHLGDEGHGAIRLSKQSYNRLTRPNPGQTFKQSRHGGTGLSTSKFRPIEIQFEVPAFSMDCFKGGGDRVGPRQKAIVGRFNVAIIGRFTPWPWGQHPDEAYLADEMVAMGAHVLRFDQSQHALPPQGVDWAIFTANERSRCHIPSWKRVCPTLLWTLDWLPDVPGREPVIETAKRVSLFVTSDRFEWNRLGIAHHKYVPGACEGAIPPFEPEPVRPCAFVGSLYNERRKAIADIVRKAGGQVLDQPGAWVYGDRLARFVQQTKVIVGDNYRNDVAGYWSSRNYVVPGAGGFLLASRVPGLDEAFTQDEHVGVYGSMDDLPRELDRWIGDDEGRERVRRNGFLHVRKHHGWRARAEALLSIMGYRPA
jgi:hypothetical protein